MTAIQQPYLSEKDYLLQERDALFKSEYYSGEVTIMAGTGKEYNKIVAAVTGELYGGLKNK